MKEIFLKLPFDITEEDAKLSLAIKLFEEGKITLGQAAELTNFSKKTFIEILGKHNVPVINYPSEELEKDFKNA